MPDLFAEECKTLVRGVKSCHNSKSLCKHYVPEFRSVSARMFLSQPDSCIQELIKKEPVDFPVLLCFALLYSGFSDRSASFSFASISASSFSFSAILTSSSLRFGHMLIAFLENNLQADGSVLVPEVLRPYMGGKEKLLPKQG